MIDFLLGVPGKLKTISDYLTTNWTPARAVNLDAAISTRAPSSSALSASTWTGTKAGFLDAAISSRATASPILEAPISTEWQSPTKNANLDSFAYLDFSAALGAPPTANFNTATPFSVTGAGILKFVAFKQAFAGGAQTITLVIDGVTMFSLSKPAADSWLIVGSLAAAAISLDQIPFRTGFSLTTTAATTTGYLYVKYHRTA